MMSILRRAALGASLAALCLSALAGGPPVETIAFGSCLREGRPAPILERVVATRPDLFVLLGDNVYADTRDMTVMRRKYESLGSNPAFARLRASVPLLAVWDDHDYGHNDAGAEYPGKDEAQRIFLDFFGGPAVSEARAHPGIYHAHVYGPPGRRVQVILLDTRFFRGPLKRGGGSTRCPSGSYVPNRDPGVTLLGESQWAWLAEQLRVPAELRIVASSIQVIPREHCFEKWANLPRERERLFALIRDAAASGVLLVSGDRHLGEISRLAPSPAGYPLYEVTSSGLNTAGGGRREHNRYRLTPDNFRQNNFGVVRVDWDAPDPEIRLEVHGPDGEVAMAHRLQLSALQVPAGTAVALETPRSARSRR